MDWSKVTSTIPFTKAEKSGLAHLEERMTRSDTSIQQVVNLLVATKQLVITEENNTQAKIDKFNQLLQEKNDKIAEVTNNLLALQEKYLTLLAKEPK